VKELPPDGRTRRHAGGFSTNGGKEYGFWDQMRERPGEWAEIPVPYTGAGMHQRKHPDFDIVVRTLKSGRKAVFARYIG
jgi:hypothetical protein